MPWPAAAYWTDVARVSMQCHLSALGFWVAQLQTIVWQWGETDLNLTIYESLDFNITYHYWYTVYLPAYLPMRPVIQ